MTEYPDDDPMRAPPSRLHEVLVWGAFVFLAFGAVVVALFGPPPGRGKGDALKPSPRYYAQDGTELIPNTYVQMQNGLWVMFQPPKFYVWAERVEIERTETVFVIVEGMNDRP